MTRQRDHQAPPDSKAFQDLLLRSAVLLDQPSRMSRQRVGLALGLGASATLTASSVAAAAAKVGALSFLKAFGVGAVAGALTLSAAGVVETMRAEPPSLPSNAWPASVSRRPASPTHSPPTSEQPKTPGPESAAGELGPQTVDKDPFRVEAPAHLPAPPTTSAASPDPDVPGNRGVSVAPESRMSRADDTIRRELAIIDLARGMLAQGDADGALRAIAEYQRAHPGGLLAEEASVVRIEALSRRGDRAQARAEATQLLRAHPQTAYAGRIESAVGNSDATEIQREPSGH